MLLDGPANRGINDEEDLACLIEQMESFPRGDGFTEGEATLPTEGITDPVLASEYYIINDCILNINNIQFSASEPGKWTPLSIPTKRRGGCNEAEDITQAEGGYSIWLEFQDGRAVVCNQVLCTGGISCPMW